MRALRIAGCGVMMALGLQLAHETSAQQAATSPPAPRESGSAGVELQRSAAIYNFKTTAEMPNGPSLARSRPGFLYNREAVRR